MKVAYRHDIDPRTGRVGHVFNVVNQSLVMRLRDGQLGTTASFSGYSANGDEHMGWTGLVKPDELTGIRVVESRRAYANRVAEAAHCPCRRGHRGIRL